MFVWVVTYKEIWEEYTSVVGVFDSEDKANEIANRVKGGCYTTYVERYEINHSNGF